MGTIETIIEIINGPDIGPKFIISGFIFLILGGVFILVSYLNSKEIKDIIAAFLQSLIRGRQ